MLPVTFLDETFDLFVIKVFGTTALKLDFDFLGFELRKNCGQWSSVYVALMFDAANMGGSHFWLAEIGENSSIFISPPLKETRRRGVFTMRQEEFCKLMTNKT